jgi:hypothetical protein
VFQDGAARLQVGRRDDAASSNLLSALPCTVDGTAVLYVDAAGASRGSRHSGAAVLTKVIEPKSTAALDAINRTW